MVYSVVDFSNIPHDLQSSSLQLFFSSGLGNVLVSPTEVHLEYLSLKISFETLNTNLESFLVAEA